MFNGVNLQRGNMFILVFVIYNGHFETHNSKSLLREVPL